MGKYWQAQHSVWGKMSVIVAALLLGQIAGVATAHAANTDITINEISSYDNSGDWVELYNSGVSPIDISSWSLKEGLLTVVKSDSFSATTIAPNGFVTVNFGSSLDETGGTISLYDADIVTEPLTSPIQTITYGTEAIPAPSQSGNSVARSYDGASTWAVGTATKGISNGLSPDVTPPSVPTGGQSVVNGNSSMLSWPAVNDDRPGNVHYQVRYATSQGDLATAPSTNVDINQFVTPPLSGGTYFWQVQSIDISDNASEWSEIWQFVIPPQDTTPPAAPASSVSNSEVLAGNKTIETTPTGDTASWHFEIYRTSSDELIISSNQASFIFDTTQLANGQYVLRYFVTDGAGNMASYDILFSIANVVEAEVPQLPPAPSLVQSSVSLVTAPTSSGASTSPSSASDDKSTTAISTPQTNISDFSSSDSDKSLAVAASDKGWQFFGYPWFVWTIGGIGVGVVSWLVRRMIITRGGDSG